MIACEEWIPCRADVVDKSHGDTVCSAKKRESIRCRAGELGRRPCDDCRTVKLINTRNPK